MSGASNGTSGVLVPKPRAGYRSATIREMEQLAPPPTGVGAFAEKLLMAAFDGIKEQDITDMLKGIMDKAKAGDMKAIKFVMDFLGKSAPPPPQVQIQMVKVGRESKNVSTHHKAGKAAPPDDDGEDDPGAGELPVPPSRVPDPPHVQVLRRFAARILHADGSTPAVGVAGQLGVDQEELTHLMQHEWFEADGGVWRLTIAGRREVG